MRVRTLRRRLRSGRSKPLVVRAGLTRTFGGLASFLAILFLCLGVYVLNDALSNPVEAQAAAMIAGAFSIALATILLFYLLKPGSRPRSATGPHRSRTRSNVEHRESGRASWMERRPASRNDLAYQRFYVDHSLVVPRRHMEAQAREISGK